jgi:NADP-reducing hydrogenase subunit HndD
MIEKAGIKFRELDDEAFDKPFDLGTSAGAIFGATGGVMEAALRYAAEVILGKPLEKPLETPEIRRQGNDNEYRVATYKIGETTISVAVASGTKAAKALLKDVEAGVVDVQFIEIMGCPGGCVNGGGQPYQPASVRNTVDLRALRAAVLYRDDEACDIRESQKNSAVWQLYTEFFGEPNSHKAHEILHTHYIKRGL